MLVIRLADGRTVERIAAGFVSSPQELSKFVHELEEEVRLLKDGEHLLIEAWQTVSKLRITKRKSAVPTEEEEMAYTSEGR